MGVLWNPRKSAGLPVARRVINILEARGVAPYLDAGLAAAFKRPVAPSFADCDLLCVLGGTVRALRARRRNPNDIPMLALTSGASAS